MLKSLTLALLLMHLLQAADGPGAPASFSNGLPTDAGFFPICVWAQDPSQAGAYKALGVNIYVALWQGPTAAQIAELKRHDMRVICHLNDYAQEHLLEDPTVVAWMHGDEPDLAHCYPRDLLKGPKGKEIIKEHWPELYVELDLANQEYNGWGLGKHPINDIQKEYRRYKEIDATRPILIQLSSSVATDGVDMGRGDRNGKTWEYPLYLEGSDMASFDIYPVAGGKADKLHLVADGVDNLKKWGAGARPLWVCIEAGFGEKVLATRDQQRAEIWMAINHGARGIIWFCHRWQDGKLISDRMPLVDADLGAAVKSLNQELTGLAPIIKSPALADLASASGATLDLGARRLDGATYVFAVERGNTAGPATIAVTGITAGTVEVLNESRVLALEGGRFSDEFTAFGTHLYKITGK